jgi:hypothetical protein
VAVTRLEIRSRSSLAGGVAFGDAGPYERIDGVAHFAVDPEAAANRAIVDLDRATRDGGGRVSFLADFCVLRPAEPARGRRRLLFDILNRGRKTAMGQLNLAPPVLVPVPEIDPGDGFLMRHGWTVAWCGWQWDVNRSDALLGLEAPEALDEDGRPISGRVQVTFQVNEPCADHLLADRVHRPYPAADTDEAGAELAYREYPDGPRTVLPRETWRFAHDESGAAVTDDTTVRLAGGFRPGLVYEVVYTTRICPVVGTGLLSMRDFVSFLRYDSSDANPCAGEIDHAYAFGVSQSGRYLRNFLYLGLNLDEAGRQVFDGLLPHVAGARRG